MTTTATNAHTTPHATRNMSDRVWLKTTAQIRAKLSQGATDAAEKLVDHILDAGRALPADITDIRRAARHTAPARPAPPTTLTLRDRVSGNRMYLTLRDGLVVGAMGADPQRYMGLTEAQARHKARYAQR